MEFKQVIYGFSRRIPRGKVASYGQLAALAGKPGAARAVGHAMRVCQDPSVPCHRVVHQDGSATRAFDTIERDTQRRLLETEGIVFDQQGKIPMAQFQWRPDLSD